jgi:hypothetical protein
MTQKDDMYQQWEGTSVGRKETSQDKRTIHLDKKQTKKVSLDAEKRTITSK